MIVQPDANFESSSAESLETFALYLCNLLGLLVIVIGAVKGSSCFGGGDDDDEIGSTVESFTISPWTCFCNWFKSTERLRWSQDDARFTTYSVKSMNITTPEEKSTKSYLPNGVDGVGTSTRKYLDAHGSDQQLPQSDRRKLEDNRLIMKAYLISKLVAARYSFEDGAMEFEERAEEKNIEIDDYKERTQAMYNLLYSGQIMVDTHATRRQQRVALKRLRKSNLNLRPSKIRELAKQMKEEAEKDKDSLETGSSGIGSTCDISKAETTTVADSNPSRASGESRFSRFLQRMGFKSSRDSAVGSSLGSVDRLGGVAVIDVQETNNWSKVQRTQPLHTYGGAQF
jgi:hypothetical protein